MANFIAGGGVAASQQLDLSQTDVFSVNGSGQLSVNWVVEAGLWQGPAGIGPVGYAPPGCALATSQQFGLTQTDIFLVNNSGQLAIYWVAEGKAWGGPGGIGPAGIAPPGACVAASQQIGLNQTDVFFFDHNGQLNVFWVDNAGAWQGPGKIGPAGIAAPGAYVAASRQFGLNQTDVFFVDKNGQLNVCWVVGAGTWGGPGKIGPAGFAPSGCALTVSQQIGLNQTDVFLIDNSGKLNVFWVLEAGAWGGPGGIGPAGIANPGSPVAASQQYGLNQTDVFFIDKTGKLNVCWVAEAGAWGGPGGIGPAGIANPGSHVAASRQFNLNQTDVFFIEKSGDLSVSWVVNAGAWGGPGKIENPPAASRFATFTMDSFGISNTRSLHNDTDFVYLSATVGANPTVFVSKSMGDVNNGNHSVGLSVEVDIPDDDTIVVFNYLIVNNSHGGNDAKEKAAQSALNTIAQEMIKHGAISAAAITVGTVLVPFFVSALAAVAGILEAGLLLFADCDGVVAAGALPFKCSDLIKGTAAGQKIAENANHPGTDSAAGCGSNSKYSTACTITTAPAIQTVLDLRGEWADGGVPGPFASVTGNSISIDMSASHRPNATGSVLTSTQISVHFPDDKTYTGTLQAPNVIRWSNNSNWTKVPATQTVFDLNGKWMSGGVLGPVITVHGNSISIDMSTLKRPTAVGTVVNSSDISVNFPDDKTYSGVLQKPNTIHWSNNATWTKFETSVIKHLFVLMMENRSFDHLLGFQGITGKDAQTGAATKAEDLAQPKTATSQLPSNQFGNLRYTVSPTAGDRTFNTYDVKHQFPDVLMQLCGQTEGQAVIKSEGLNGAAYPPVVAAADGGFAADYAINADPNNPGEPMRCFAPGTLPVLTALAKEFVLCDHWFSSLPGPTEPNRMFAHAASSGGWDDSPSNGDYEKIFGLKAAGDASTGVSFANGTIFDALRQAKVPFRIYAGDQFPQVGLLSGISLLSDVDDFENFAADINEPTYDAAYTFIEPRYDTISQNLGLPFVNNAQHPANSVELGEALIKRVYETIRNSPLWNQSMLIVTWDEHGGFFDHVTPPPAKRIPAGSPSKDIEGKSYGFMFDRYGLRVPAVVISPWCPQNLIDHREFEHSCIPATIEQLFGLKPLTVRDTEASGLQTLATLSAPRNVTATIPNPITVSQPTGPVPGTPAGSGSSTFVSSVGLIAGKAPSAAQPTSTTMLDLNDPWLSSAVAVAVKAHTEAVPEDAAKIKARGFGLKTVGDLAQYHKEVTPIVQNKRVLVRQQNVAARKLVASATSGT